MFMSDLEAGEFSINVEDVDASVHGSKWAASEAYMGTDEAVMHV